MALIVNLLKLPRFVRGFFLPTNNRLGLVYLDIPPITINIKHAVTHGMRGIRGAAYMFHGLFHGLLTAC